MITGVHLITGLIGSGKTLRAVSLIQKEVDAGRAVFACNINGLNIPGVIPFDDPKQWQDLPPGSLLVVDEAQRYWRSRRTADIPVELQAMETSRHDAVSFLLLTQQPTYLDKHLRGLVTMHEHLYRRMGLQSAQLFAWDRCIDDPQSTTFKDAADQSIFIYPKEHFGKYKSAEQHTVKVRIGTRGKLIIAAAVVVAVAIGYIVVGVTSDDESPKAATASAGASPQAKTRTAAAAALDSEQYFARMVPRASAMPWSASIFDHRNVASEPQLFCASSLAGAGADGQRLEASCTCLTEQGTTYKIERADCINIARNGPAYDPFKRPDRDNDRDRDRNRDAGQGTREPQPFTAAITTTEQVAGYGDIGYGNSTSTAAPAVE